MNTKQEAQATDRPWEAFKAPNGGYAIRRKGESNLLANIAYVAEPTTFVAQQEIDANRALIVQAVNNFDAMRDALESLLADVMNLASRTVTERMSVQNACAVLANLEGGK